MRTLQAILALAFFGWVGLGIHPGMGNLGIEPVPPGLLVQSINEFGPVMTGFAMMALGLATALLFAVKRRNY